MYLCIILLKKCKTEQATKLCTVYVHVHVCVYNVQFDNIVESVIKSMYAAPALAWRGVVWYTGTCTCSIHHLFPWSINRLYEVHVINKN